jgi:endoglucanase
MKKLFLLLFFFYSFLNAITFNEFRKKYVINNSYIIDPFNNNRVTSESQGYGLLLAYLYDKPELFDSIWQWTKKNLQRKDYLFSWHWNKKILDSNNASDGDILIAYALLKASKKFSKKYYLNQALKIINSIAKMTTIICPNYAILLPGKYGFIKNTNITVYPSYYIPFAFKKFYLNTLNPVFSTLYYQTYKLYQIKNLTTKLHFSLIDKRFTTYSYSDLDVYRIILYAYLDKKRNLKKLKTTFQKVNIFFKKHGYLPLTYPAQNNYKSPYCVYKWFYMLYKDTNYLIKYKQLLKKSRKNYFCDALELIEKGFENEKDSFNNIGN